MTEQATSIRREFHHTEFSQTIDTPEAFEHEQAGRALLADAGDRDARLFMLLHAPGREVFVPGEGLHGKITSLNRIRTHKNDAAEDWRIEVETASGRTLYLPRELGYTL